MTDCNRSFIYMRSKSSHKRKIIVSNSNKNSSIKTMLNGRSSKTNPSFVEVLSNRNQDSRLTALQLPNISNITALNNIIHLGIIHAYKP